MSLLFIILVLILGITFVLLEIIVFPGISVAGILGAILLIVGIYFAYIYHGNTIGHVTLVGTLVMTIVAAILAFRYASWKKITLETSITSKIESLRNNTVAVGDEVITVSRLAPMGSVKANGRIVEAKSRNGYVDVGKIVKVVKIQNNILIVDLPKL